MSEQRRGLGRGLEALLGQSEGEGRTVLLAEIEPNPYQPRGSIAEDGLRELAASIRAHGLIQPLVVTPHGDGYRLIAGERRWRAAGLAGLESVPVVVREASPRDMLAVALIENVQRADLDPLEAAAAYKRLADEFGLTHAEVAELVGKSRTAVTNAVRLLSLEAELQELLRAGALTEGHARALLGTEAGPSRVLLGSRAAAERWSVREVERAVREPGEPHAADGEVRPERASAAPQPEDPHDRAAMQAMEEALGTRVELRRRGDGGTVTIHFYSAEELASVYRRITGTP